MRKIILGLGISLDGYIARRDGAVDFLFMPKDFSMEPFMASIDAAIMGRMTYEVALAMGGGFGGSKNPNYVFSRTLPAGERKGVTIVNEPPADLVRRLRERDGKHIWLMGAASSRASSSGRPGRRDLPRRRPDPAGRRHPTLPERLPTAGVRPRREQVFLQGLVSLTYERVRAKPKRKS